MSERRERRLNMTIRQDQAVPQEAEVVREVGQEVVDQAAAEEAERQEVLLRSIFGILWLVRLRR